MCNFRVSSHFSRWLINLFLEIRILKHWIIQHNIIAWKGCRSLSEVTIGSKMKWSGYWGPLPCINLSITSKPVSWSALPFPGRKSDFISQIILEKKEWCPLKYKNFHFCRVFLTTVSPSAIMLQFKHIFLTFNYWKLEVLYSKFANFKCLG